MVIITGKLIKELREEHGISQQKLAEMIGISQAHIAKIEGEKVNPTLSTVNKIMSILKEKDQIKSKEIMKTNIVSVKPSHRVTEATEWMRKLGISQIPVIDNNLYLGSITEKTIINNMEKNLRRTKVRDIMEKAFPIVSSEESIDVVKLLLEHVQAVLVSDNQKIVGIITKSDILALMK